MSNRLQPLDVLLVEDSEDDAFLLKRQLRDAGYNVNLERVDNATALATALARKDWDIVFSDFSMPQFNGMEAMKIVQRHDADLPFIIISGTVGEERAAELMKLGAHDYVIKGNVRRLVPVVEREIKEAKVRRDHRRAQEHIRHIAYYDPMTNLPNRHRLVEDIELALREQRPFGLLLLNFNNFREINSALGHSKGDALIQEAATRLRQVHFEGVQLYHMHGNEFVFLTNTAEQSKLQVIATQALLLVGPHFRAAGFPIHMAARIGIAVPNSDDNDANTVLQHADLAVSFAKREGKNYAWYDANRDPSSSDRLALLADLSDAIRSDQLYLVFQPKIGCETHVIIGCEALVRWQHPQRGMVGPDIFIPMAESAGLIDDLTRHVLRRAVAQIESWNKRGIYLAVAMNLSAKNLFNEALMKDVLRAATRLETGQLEIEITETALMHDPERAVAILHQVHEAGVRIYVDDFGTGFSSLGYLKRLPIHAIKIDRSFIMDLATNPDSEAIVTSTIGLAHNLGLKIVAEGVESNDIWQRLISFRCDEGQGYYFSKPLAAEALENFVAQWEQPHAKSS